MAEHLDATALEAPPIIAFRDGEGDVRDEFVSVVSEAIAAKSPEILKVLLGDLHEADLGDLLRALDPAVRPQLIELMGGAFDFAALNELDEGERAQIIEELDTETVVEGVRELESDDAVYLLEGLDDAEQEEILDHMPAVEAAALKRALDYPEGSAGRLMQTDVIAVPPFWSVGQTIDHMRDTLDLPDRFYELYVVDPRRRLLGSVALDRLLRSKRQARIQDILSEARNAVHATDDQENVARLFERYNLVSAAVVDEEDRLVGTLTVDDIVDVIQEEAEEDLKALGGVGRDEELSDSVWTITRSRFGWLFINLVTAFIAASVLNLFEGELEKMVALAVLAPIVASQGGNAATQTMTIAVRALATREIVSSNVWRIILRETAVGLLNGIGFAIVTGVVAALWFASHSIGIVIGIAMVINLVAGALGGILIPLGLQRLKSDPAVSSGVFVTTVTDVVGFFAFLAIATWWFRLG
jgi:magnesium transporter